MAKIKYFADVDGQALELTTIFPMDNKEFTDRFPGVKGRRYDSFAKLAGCEGNLRQGATVYPVTRQIEYKTANPSKHVCNDKCINATGKIMRCECSCGGKNHGRGGFVCE